MASPPASPAPAAGDALQLSPFLVSSAADDGYRAANTRASLSSMTPRVAVLEIFGHLDGTISYCKATLRMRGLGSQ